MEILFSQPHPGCQWSRQDGSDGLSKIQTWDGSDRKYNVDLDDLESLRKSGQEFGPYFKEATWADEKEVRLLLVFDKPIKAEKIAIDFDAPIADVRENLRTCVVSSPWLDMPKIADTSIDMCQTSICKGKIRDR